jgi:hypothetical protein
MPLIERVIASLYRSAFEIIPGKTKDKKVVIAERCLAEICVKMASNDLDHTHYPFMIRE